MEEKYIKLLAKTNYNALTSEEKELLNELCTNQSEFEQAKQLMNELTALDPEPNLFDSSKVKKRLDDEFLEVYTSKEGGGWINFLFPPLKPILNRPGIQLAMVLVLFLGSYLVLELMDFNNSQTVQLAKNEKKISNENGEETKESEIDENLISDKNKIDHIELENNQSIAEISSYTEMEVPLESQETIRMIDPVLSDEFIAGSALSEDFTELDFEASRHGFKGKKDVIIETNKLLIPTVQDNPDLLEGLFVTF